MATSFPDFVSEQLEELRSRLVAEFERLRGEDWCAEGEEAEEAEEVEEPGEAEEAQQEAASNVSWAEAHPDLEVPDEGTALDIQEVEVHRNRLEWLNQDPNLRNVGRLRQRPSMASYDSAQSLARSWSHELSDGAHRDGEVRAVKLPTIAPMATIDGDKVCRTPLAIVGENGQLAVASPGRMSDPSVRGTYAGSATSGLGSKDIFAPNGVIYPDSGVYGTWYNFVSVLVLFSCFLTPLRYGFNESSGAMDDVDVALDILFGFDILLTFNVAVLKKDGIVISRKRIFLAYVLSARFFIDIAATVPVDNLWLSFMDEDPTNIEIASVMGLLRLLRVNRLLMLFRKLQKNTYFNLLGVVVAKFVVFILLCTHTSGCIFYKLSHYGGFDNNTWVGKFSSELPSQGLATRYMHVLFWAVGTFKAGPAAGTFSPTSNIEMLWACITMMVNICLQTYLVSNMAALLTTTDVRIYNMRNQLMQVRDFAARNKLPHELCLQLSSFIKFKFSTNEEADQNLLTGLPDLYRQRISHVLFEDLVNGVDIFHNCAPVFLRQLHCNFKASLFMPHEQLATIDEPATSLQIVAEGEVEMLNLGGSIVDVCRMGESYTAVSFLCKVGQPFSVRTRTVCRVLVLSGSSWDAVCTAFPQNLEIVRHNLLMNCENKVAEFVTETSGRMVYSDLLELVRAHMVQQEELSIGLICSAAARGDLQDLKRRLATNSPDCCNYDSRTPLHLAASHGQLEACRLLLDAQARVDPVDNFGRTPLLESCRTRQDEVAYLLYKRGAKLGSVRNATYGPAGPTKDLKRKVSCRDLGEHEEIEKTSEAAELCQAAANVDQLWYLKSLMRYGANPNRSDYDARTALHVANACGNKAAVELLIRHPLINLDPRDNFGRTPLMEAVRHGHEACARLMRSRGAFHGFITDLKEADDPNGIPAGQELCQAAFSNQVNYLNNLVTYCGIHVDAADYDLRTALHLASAEGNMTVAVSLVQQKADVQRKDRWGHTAITEAQSHGHAELAKVLKVMGAQQSTS